MATLKKCLLIVNPIAGGNDKTALVGAAKAFADQENVEIIEFETQGEDDEQEITRLYEEHRPERILVIGGDGTVKIGAEAVSHQDVIIGILPAGSANGLSVDLGLPNDIQESLKVAFYGKAMEMDMVCINDRKSLHLSDIGVNAELIRKYESGTIRGKLGYALQAINTLTDLEDPFHAKIKANGEIIETEARMVVIANTQKYGTGVTINPVGVMDDGKFEIVILKSLDVFLIGKILAGNMPVENKEDVEIISAQEAEITTNFPVCFQVDGEFCGEVDKLQVRILHREMKVAVP